MASSQGVWGIDVGQCALKAIKLRPIEGGQLELVAFDVIEHSKILSQPDADRDELVRETLKKFASRHQLSGEKFVVGVPGQQTFARFCKMPPIDLKRDAKKIPQLVRYEASQQIPFDINDVVWDYQVFTSEGSPDIEVGIFAIRKDLIRKHLGFFAEIGIAPLAVQAIPAALYNFAKHDLADEAGGANVLVDVGAQNTDLIVVEPNSAWTRNIPLGGNAFTEALVRSFKVSFAKAEQYKRTAADSKYARQIFQAMRPIFADLVAELQRSIGFYSSNRRGAELARVVALGNAFHLPGLQKYLENSLQVAGGVHKLERFEKLAASDAIAAPEFQNNLLSFAAAYGLSIQGLGLSRIQTSLLPTEMVRVAIWKKKAPYFMATAASLMLAAVVPFGANALDMQKLTSESSKSDRAATNSIIAEAKKLRDEYKKAQTDTGALTSDIDGLLALQKDRKVIAKLVSTIHSALPRPNPPELATAASGKALRELIESDPKRFKRTDRGQFKIESFRIEYVPNVDAITLPPGGGTATAAATPTQDPAAPGPPAPAPPPAKKPPPQAGAGPTGGGFIVRINGRLLYGSSRGDAARWLETELYNSLRQASQQPGLGFYIPDDASRSDRAICEPLTTPYYKETGGAAQQPADPRNPSPRPADPSSASIDPVTGEDARTDWQVAFAFKVKMGDKPAPPEAAPAGAPPAPAKPPGKP